jgi:hypothetical protein
MEAMGKFWKTLMGPEVTKALKGLVGDIAPVMATFIKMGAGALPAMAKAARVVYGAFIDLFKYLFDYTGKVGAGSIEELGKSIELMANDFKQFVSDWIKSGNTWAYLFGEVTTKIAFYFVGIGAAILLVTFLFAKLALAMGLGAGLAGFMTAMAAGVASLGGALTATAVGWLAFAGSLALVGLGIGVVAAGIALIIDRYAAQKDAQANLNKSTLDLAEGLTALGKKDAMRAVHGGLMVMSASMLTFADAVDKLDEDKLEEMNKFLRNVRTLAIQATNSMGGFAKSIDRVSAALTNIPQGKMTGFSWNLTKVMKATSQVSGESSKGAVKVIKEAVKYQKEIRDNPAQLDAIVALLRATNATPAAAAPGGSGQTIIKLELAGTVLDKYIWDAVNQELVKYTR